VQVKLGACDESHQRLGMLLLAGSKTIF